MSELHIVDEINEIAARVTDGARPHDCAGLHCATCEPAATIEALEGIAERVRLLDERWRGRDASLELCRQDLEAQGREIRRLRETLEAKGNDVGA